MTVWTVLGSGLQPVLSVLGAVVPKGRPCPVQLPRCISPQPPTPPAQVEEVLRKLDGAKGEWVKVSCAERAGILRRCMDSLLQVECELATVSTEAKGSYGAGIGEERVALLPILLGLGEYVHAMQQEGRPKPLAVTKNKDGQTVVQVFPQGPFGLLMPTFRGEIWIQPGAEPSQGAVYRRKAAGQASPGGVALVLGAGNQVSVAALDLLHKLIADDEVVVVKTNPVNDYVGPLLRRAFAPLVDLGVLEFVYGGREVGELLTHHPLVTSIHLTGSADTYNAIVWGSPSAQRSGPLPALPQSKPITAELGNVTPYIIVPGRWSKSDLEYHAESIATAVAQNAGHNCLGLEVLVTDREWPQRVDLMRLVRAKLAALPQREPFYPGSRAKWERFRESFPSAIALGLPSSASGASHGVASAGGGAVPWLLAEGLDPECCRPHDENWCGVFQEVALSGTGGSAPAFMAAAAKFVNTRLWGSLAATVIAHPTTQGEHGEAWASFLSRLRYGSISVNVPALVAYGVPSLGWGAFPGNTPHDVESGIGFVHNCHLYDHVQKSVLHGPWRYAPRPFWLVDNRAASSALLVPSLMRFAVAATDGDLLRALWFVTLVAAAALRG